MHLRCKLCRMRQEICICDAVAQTKVRIAKVSTRIVLLMHKRERSSTTNTGHLAHQTLPFCEVHYRGLEPGSAETSIPTEEYGPSTLLLFPDHSASVLSSALIEAIRKPITLIVPDGSWRQASKVHKREPTLLNTTRIKLDAGPPSRYRLRREPRSDGLATFEAIARALGVIEGPDVQREMERLFELMTDLTLQSRAGVLSKEAFKNKFDLSSM